MSSLFNFSIGWSNWIRWFERVACWRKRMNNLQTSKFKICIVHVIFSCSVSIKVLWRSELVCFAFSEGCWSSSSSSGALAWYDAVTPETTQWRQHFTSPSNIFWKEVMQVCREKTIGVTFKMGVLSFRPEQIFLKSDSCPLVLDILFVHWCSACNLIW